MARRRGHIEEKILAALRQAEGGTTVVDVWRQVGISDQPHRLLKFLGIPASAACWYGSSTISPFSPYGGVSKIGGGSGGPR